MESLLDKFLETGFFNIISAIITTIVIAIPLAIVFYKIFKGNMDSIMNKFTSVENEFMDYNKSKYMIETVTENYTLFKMIIENFSGDVNDVYENILDEIKYIEKAFVKNYINGSSKLKALEVVQLGYSNLMDIISNSTSTINSEFIMVVMNLTDVSKNLIFDIIDELSKMDNSFMKSSLIRKYFNNIKQLITYTKIKQCDFKSFDTDDKIKKEMMKYFLNIDVNLRVAQKHQFDDHKNSDKTC